jgi:uncharacterized protein YciI
MLFALICTDKPDHLAVRMTNRDAHLAYFKDSGMLQMAGPFLNDDDAMCGSLLIIEADDIAAAQELAAEDPYAKAGLFSDVRIEAWKKVIG